MGHEEWDQQHWTSVSLATNTLQPKYEIKHVTDAYLKQNLNLNTTNVDTRTNSCDLNSQTKFKSQCEL